MKSSLSAGEIIRSVLTDLPLVRERGIKIFPVFQPTEKAILPYIDYRRDRLEAVPTKGGAPMADTVTMVLNCYAASYAASVEMAEAVREALDHRAARTPDLYMRGCYLTDSSEDFQGDAYIQQLVFSIKI